MGLPMVILHRRQLRGVRRNRHPSRHPYAFHRMRAAVARVGFAAVRVGGDSLFHGVAGRVSVPWAAAKYAVAFEQERSGRVVDCFRSFRVLAHYQYGISQLALCDSRVHCRSVLWLDVEKNQFDFRLRTGARVGRCHLAFSLPHGLTYPADALVIPDLCNSSSLTAGRHTFDPRRGYTPPPVFGTRGCKLLKTKIGISEKRGKSAKEAASR